MKRSIDIIEKALDKAGQALKILKINNTTLQRIEEANECRDALHEMNKAAALIQSEVQELLSTRFTEL